MLLLLPLLLLYLDQENVSDLFIFFQIINNHK